MPVCIILNEPMTQWHLDGELQFTVGQHSIAGLKEENEDAIGIRIPKGLPLTTKGAVAVIADGVSAAEAGKEASQTCVTNFLADYFSTPDSWSVKKSTTQVLIALNRWLYGKGQHFLDAQKGYVSTLSCAVFKSHTGHLFHVGDTRIYRFRELDGKADLEQLTRDHATQINDEQTYLTRAMGLDVRLDVDYRTITLQKGDVFILTSDGVHDKLRHHQLVEHMSSLGDNFEEKCQQIIQHALDNGSSDNLSCQIIRVDRLPAQDINDVYQHLTALPFPPPLQKGSVIDGFRVEKELHASPRSQLYLVSDVETGKRYCMKTPSVNFEDDAAYIERFILESWIGSRLQSPHIIKIVNTKQPKKFLYYLMEYIDGITLEDWIKQNPKPSVQNVMYIVEQIGKGLRAFHRRESLHQDLKPGNIMVDYNGETKIIDFGSCHVRGIDEISTPLQRDIVLGTANYSAPETVLKGIVTTQADIFSLGVIVFEMLTNHLPFNGKLETCRTEKAYLKTKYVPSFDLNPLVPVWIDGAIKKALRYRADRRYGDISEFIHELTNPNPKYKQQRGGPLLEKDPALFWQMVSGILLLALCVSVFFHAV